MSERSFLASARNQAVEALRGLRSLKHVFKKNPKNIRKQGRPDAGFDVSKGSGRVFWGEGGAAMAYILVAPSRVANICTRSLDPQKSS